MKNYIINFSFVYRYKWLFLLPFTLVSSPLFAASLADQAAIKQKQEKIVRLYDRKHYAKANEEIEFLLPLLINRADRAKFELYQAYCNFHEKKYLISANQFRLFIKQYPAFQQVEEALFMRGYSLACENVDIRLDQTVTDNAIRCLEHYLAVYPTGAYLDKAADALQNLEERLMQKHFQAAALYVRLGYYRAAIFALKEFNKVYPEASVKEKVRWFLIKCYAKSER